MQNAALPTHAIAHYLYALHSRQGYYSHLLVATLPQPRHPRPHHHSHKTALALSIAPTLFPSPTTTGQRTPPLYSIHAVIHGCDINIAHRPRQPPIAFVAALHASPPHPPSVTPHPNQQAHWLKPPQPSLLYGKD